MEEVDCSVVGAAPGSDESLLPRTEGNGFDGGGVQPAVTLAASVDGHGGSTLGGLLAEGAEEFPWWCVVVVGGNGLWVGVVVEGVVRRAVRDEARSKGVYRSWCGWRSGVQSH